MGYEKNEYNTSIRLGCFGVALFLVQHFLYSSGLTPKLVQQILAPIKKREHNGAVKSRGQFNNNLRTLLVFVFYTLPLSNRIRLVQHFLSTAQVPVVQLFLTQNAQSNRPMTTRRNNMRGQKWPNA